MIILRSDFCDSNRQLAEELQNGALEDDERELLLLLSTPHLKVHTLTHIHTHTHTQLYFVSFLTYTQTN